MWRAEDELLRAVLTRHPGNLCWGSCHSARRRLQTPGPPKGRLSCPGGWVTTGQLPFSPSWGVSPLSTPLAHGLLAVGFHLLPTSPQIPQILSLALELSVQSSLIGPRAKPDS